MNYNTCHFFPLFLILTKVTTQTTAPRGADLFVPLKCRHTVLVIRILKGRNMPEYFPYACLTEHICPSRIIARLRFSQRWQGHRGIRRLRRKLDLLGWVQLTRTPFVLFSSLPTCYALLWSFPQNHLYDGSFPISSLIAILPLYPHVPWSFLLLPCTKLIHKGIGENMFIKNKTKETIAIFPSKS